MDTADADARALTARLTLHSGSDTTARDDARERVESALEGLDGWRIEGCEIVEPPAAPFEPHTLAVRVVADAGTTDDAEEALARNGIEVV
ncbi:hypothetical protein [Saliphagus sp. LR7]|uniref:hypothetical protein n=1 Tax=Saliphagus sp. LR7 TaxID=2282654 RepID=UPI000DF7A8F2|nr:hypothetical protein [Saliphagus sp. LR7]